MCRMLGMVSNLDTYLNFTYGILSDALRTLCEEHKICHAHGVGFAWLSDSKWELRKDAKPLWRSSIMRDLVNYTRSKAMILHARLATYPEYSLQGPKQENAHPFLAEAMGFRWVFAQNGSMQFDPTVVKVRPSEKILEYKGRVYSLTSYGVDSEVFFRVLLHEINEYGGEEPQNVVTVLERLLESDVLQNYFALNFILGTNRYLYALRLYNEEKEEFAKRYTLFYMLRKGSSLAGQMLRKKPNELNFFVSSEPLTSNKWIELVHKSRPGFPEEDWRSLGNREMVIVPLGKPQNFVIERIS